MAYSLSQASLPVFAIGLDALSAVLGKAEAFAQAKKIDPAVLLASRLAPDMFALARQVQLVSDHAKNGAARLAGVEPPRFEDNEKTMEELRARIAKAIDYLKSIPAGALEASEERDIKVPAGERTLEFKGLVFLQRWAIPNVFFHITTAYNILRHNGVDIGKRDYLGSP